MSDAATQKTNLVDNLDQHSLLNLAAKELSSGEPAASFALPTSEELESMFADLQIREMVGSGGMGCVFRATQSRLERDVALKLLPRELGTDDMFAERFAREARAMARLNHPNIVSIHDFGKKEDLHYLIMEYMDGMSLRELLDAGPVPLADVLRIFEQVCQALAYAHAEGVVHRDIKPENILFNRMGHVALADFGLARLATDSQAAVSLTQTRQAMGTLNYMAPEQWENPKAVDFRADIYSLGILLYEMLTGRIPRGSFPPASSLSEATPDIDEAIHRALKIDASDRHQSVQKFCQAVIAGHSESAASGPKVGFDENGTLTNFVNVGANVLKAIPVPQAPSTDHIQTTAIWTSGILAFLTCLVANIVWIDTPERYVYGVDCHVLINRVQVPVFLLPVAGGVLFALAILRNRIHPLRADFLSIVICALAIAHCVFAFHELYPDHQNLNTVGRTLTIAPFITFGLFCLQGLETLLRIGYLALVPFRRAYDYIRSYCDKEAEKERRKKERKRRVWRARWRSFVDGWHEFAGIKSDDKPASKRKSSSDDWTDLL